MHRYQNPHIFENFNVTERTQSLNNTEPITDNGTENTPVKALGYIGDFDPIKWKWSKMRTFTGHTFERFVLGISSYDHVKIHGIPRYEPFEKALEIASRCHIHWNPRKYRPSNPAHRMLKAVEMQFYFEFGEIPEIDMYRCVGTAADECHGVDCFFCIRGTYSVALIDLTENPEKVDLRSQRHIYFRREDLEELNLRVFAKKVMKALLMPLDVRLRI